MWLRKICIQKELILLSKKLRLSLSLFSPSWSQKMLRIWQIAEASFHASLTNGYSQKTPTLTEKNRMNKCWRREPGNKSLLPRSRSVSELDLEKNRIYPTTFWLAQFEVSERSVTEGKESPVVLLPLPFARTHTINKMTTFVFFSKLKKDPSSLSEAVDLSPLKKINWLLKAGANSIKDFCRLTHSVNHIPVWKRGKRRERETLIKRQEDDSLDWHNKTRNEREKEVKRSFSFFFLNKCINLEVFQVLLLLPLHLFFETFLFLLLCVCSLSLKSTITNNSS